MTDVHAYGPARANRRPLLDERIARAAGCDAGNRSMRDAGRSAWNAEDWNAACDTFDRLMRLIEPAPSAAAGAPSRKRAA